MKKTAAILLAICLALVCFPVAAFAKQADADGGKTVISVTVPESHSLTVQSSDNVSVSYEGTVGDRFSVPRLSDAQLTLRPKDGYTIKQVLLNGEDVTDEICDGVLTIKGVYEDMTLEILTEAGGSTTETSTTTTETSTTTTEASTSTTETSTSTTETSTSTTETSTTTTETSTSTTESSGSTTETSDSATEELAPKTGDESRVLLGLALLLASVAGLTGVITCGRTR